MIPRAVRTPARSSQLPAMLNHRGIAGFAGVELPAATLEKSNCLRCLSCRSGIENEQNVFPARCPIQDRLREFVIEPAFNRIDGEGPDK